MDNVKQPWNHTQMCASCQASETPPDVHYTTGQSGCKHFRGGKSAKDNKRHWPRLVRGAVPTTVA